MILTNCASCAAPLAHDAPRCVRCKTRYCNSTCQHDHWRRGHKQICKKIHRGGNAEQYYADKKCKEAVAVAVEKCADDTKGQTCYICTEALHWKTKEGLVRGCACRGTAGFAHVSCLAEQAKVLLAEAEDNNLDDKATDEWNRWSICSLCEQRYHGFVFCALGWECWKTYVGREERDKHRCAAMEALANSLTAAIQHKDSLIVREAQLSILRRLGASEETMIVAKGNLAFTYQVLGRTEALQMRQETYAGKLKFFGGEHESTFLEANNYAALLLNLKRFEEARSLLRRTMPAARRVLGDSHDLMLKIRWIYSEALYKDDDATLDDLREAVTTLKDLEQIARRMLGNSTRPQKEFRPTCETHERRSTPAKRRRAVRKKVTLNSATIQSTPAKKRRRAVRKK